ncbi:MAG: DUF4229 domain-containing protein [Jatrophihabitans sp.]
MPGRPTHPLAALWIYTALRVVLFGLLFGVLWLVGVNGLLAAVIAAVLSLPLSYVLLAKPRARLAEGMHEQFAARKARTAELDAELSGEDTAADGRG